MTSKGVEGQLDWLPKHVAKCAKSEVGLGGGPTAGSKWYALIAIQPTGKEG